MKIISIQVGMPRTVEYRGQSVRTGIFKDPVKCPVFLHTLSLEGDGQADLKVHGGRDKALYAYAHDTYAWWKRERPQDDFPPGAMGENLSVDFLPEDQICIGDTYEIGDAIVQVTQPRFPCQKLVVKFQDPLVLKQFMTLGRPGVYYRVLKEGLISAGQSFKLVDRETVLVSVQELFEFNKASAELTRVREFLKLKTLNAQWREKLEALL